MVLLAKVFMKPLVNVQPVRLLQLVPSS